MFHVTTRPASGFERGVLQRSAVTDLSRGVCRIYREAVTDHSAGLLALGSGFCLLSRSVGAISRRQHTIYVSREFGRHFQGGSAIRLTQG